MGRKLLADPRLPSKLEAGHAADILPCIYCYTCISAIFTSDPSRCAVNPETGFEYLGTPVQSSAKRIVVIGGGPAGMEAARRLDIRSEEHTSELQSLMRISYAVSCLQKKTYQTYTTTTNNNIKRKKAQAHNNLSVNNQ